MEIKGRILLLSCLILLVSTNVKAQSSNDVLNLLIQKGTITQNEADSLRADAAIKQQEQDSKRKLFNMLSSKVVNLSGLLHFRYQQLDEAGKKDGFDLRRARLDFRANLSPIIGFRVQTELANSPKILDAYGEFKLHDAFNITVGQFLIPFSMENLESSNKMLFIDYSQVVDALAARGKDVIGNQNGRDVGVQVSGNLLSRNDRALLDYKLGIFNGSGTNVADTSNEAKDVIGRLGVHPIEGLEFGCSYLNGWAKFGKPLANHARIRYGADVRYTCDCLTLQAEYIQGEDGAVKRKGWYAEGAYFVLPHKFQVMAKYDSYDPNTAVAGNISNAYSAGLTYYFSTLNKISAVYTLKREQHVQINNNVAAIQLQLAF